LDAAVTIPDFACTAKVDALRRRLKAWFA